MSFNLRFISDNANNCVSINLLPGSSADRFWTWGRELNNTFRDQGWSLQDNIFLIKRDLMA